MVNRNGKKIGHGIYHGQGQQYTSVVNEQSQEMPQVGQLRNEPVSAGLLDILTE
jgi:hypothetical protein